jgi:hypothetical protein
VKNWLRALLVVFVSTVATPLTLAYAQPQPSTDPLSNDRVPEPEREEQMNQLLAAMGRLPLAAGLASVLAVRPRRRGTPERLPHVVQTQIILAVVGAVVMLVVGSSLARAFGIVGAAGLVRYRARIDNPKDAGVMLSTLAVGLAAGVGLWMIAVFATAFILAMLWVLESVEPKALKIFELKIKAKDPAALKPKVDELFKQHHIAIELRSETPEELMYEVKLPFDKKTDRISNAVLKLTPEKEGSVEWDEKKPKK